MILKKISQLNKILSLNYISQFIIVSIALLSSACGGPKGAKISKLPTYQQLVETSPIFEKSFTGFMLFDPSSEAVLHAKNADRYFTPASNTKIFTLYTSLQILGDSMPAIRYIESGDSLIFWGTGDPSLKHPYLASNNRVIDFLKNSDKQLFFTSENFKDSRFGAGWSWDDYYYSFQPEKSAFPFHGNIIKVDKTKDDPYFRVEPGYFSDSFSKNNKVKGRSLKRISDYNIFEYNEAAQSRSYTNDHPFIYSDQLAVNLLISEIGKNISILTEPINLPDDAKVIYSYPVDSIYKRLMQESDNFIAEQLLLTCGDKMFGEMNTNQVIQFAKDSLLQNFPDEPIWRDGSGLSRYNLFTPRTIVHLLNLLHQQIPQERLLDLFPAGGISGTIEDWYGNKTKPYIFAKTGTLSNNHCLSGYLITSSGKTLIFSFMHNNFKGRSKPFKQEMEKVLWDIYLNN